MKIKITRRTFHKRALKVIVNDKDLALVNVFGIGVWILKSKQARDAWEGGKA